ncbi:MAG: hypothetical protein LBG46_01085 [Elusimicrobiota bacterium]|nr:hypothetical protein [Elusimicrobiota bacterium]
MFEFENEKIITKQEDMFCAVMEALMLALCVPGAIFVLCLIKSVWF